MHCKSLFSHHTLYAMRFTTKDDSIGVCQQGQQHIWRSDMCFATFESLLQIDVARVFLTNFVFILIVIDDLIEVDYPERVNVSSLSRFTRCLA